MKKTNVRSVDSEQMTQSKKENRVPIIVRKRPANDSALEDRIASEHPHCALPSHYFDLMLSKMKREGAQPRSLLSVETWEGRKIVSVETSDS